MDLSNNQFFPELRFQYNDKKVLNQMSDIMLKTTKTLECVIDYNWINILVENSLFFNILTDFKIKQKNIAVRFITTITPENISNCTKLMKFVELRHSDDIIGYLGISDRKQFFNYIGAFKQNFEEINTNLQVNFIHITNNDFIQMQSIFFEKLWDTSILATERITQIKRILFDNSLLNTHIRDLHTIKELIPKIIQSAVEEILLIFPTVDSFCLIEDNNKVLELLSKAVNKYIKVRIIIHIESEDSNIRKQIDQKIKETDKVLWTYVNYTTKKIDTNTIIIIADQAISFLISIKENNKNTFNDAIELASISNRESTLSAMLSLFDSLWIRSDIEKQKIVKHAYFKIFKEPQLKDENYRRKWITEHKKSE